MLLIASKTATFRSVSYKTRQATLELSAPKRQDTSELLWNSLIIPKKKTKKTNLRTVNECILATPRTSNILVVYYETRQDTSSNQSFQISSLINGGHWITLMLTWDIEHY